MDDPLPSWHDGAAKRAVLDLVARAGDQASPDYVSPAARIATVDNDGTLWCEKPFYVQADFLIRRFREQAEADPALAETQPYRAALEGDAAYFGALQEHLPDLVKAVTRAYAGITPEAFEEAALRFFAEARHPRFAVPYARLTYAPMQELLAHLRAGGFKVYITTGGGRDFVRAIAEEFYGVPREYTIGTAGGLGYRDGELLRTTELPMPVDDGPGKPVHIWARLGRRPTLAVGNSDGDFEMLEFARHGVLLHHDDAEREYAYDAGTERALAAAPERGWTVVSMKDDFRTVFAGIG